MAPGPADGARELTIAIAGGGAAGMLAAIALVRHPSRRARRIVLVEPSAEPGAGVAYGTRAASHLLNVRAAGMSALPDEPGHFAAWCVAQGITDDPAAFVPRRVYGRYLRETLEAAVSTAGGTVRVEHVQGLVTAVAADGERVALATDGVGGGAPGRATSPAGGAPRGGGRGASPAGAASTGRATTPSDVATAGAPLLADHLLLATGNRATRPAWAPTDPRVVTDPWTPDALDGIGPDDAVTIVGSGLTAIDVVLSLDDAGHRAPVRLVSSHGLLPAVHAPGVLPGRPAAIAPGDPGADRVRTLVRALRTAAADADDWRRVVDGMRPVTVALWRGLPDAERRRALRHLARRWDVHRHRMAPEIAARLDALRAAGRLTVGRGRVTDVRPAADGLHVTTVDRGRPSIERCGALVLCMGPSADPCHDPLLARLIADGVAVRDPLGLGLRVDDAGRVRRPDGRAWGTVHALGSLRKGAEWEATAVPELRVHAGEAAAAILGEG